MTVIYGTVVTGGLNDYVDADFPFYTGKVGARERRGEQLEIAFAGKFRKAWVGQGGEVEGLGYVVDRGEDSLTTPGMVSITLNRVGAEIVH